MSSARVEAKVKAATGAATVVGLIVAFLNGVQGDSRLLGALPAWAQAVAVVVVPPLVTFLTAWKARHTPRPDVTVLTPED